MDDLEQAILDAHAAGDGAAMSAIYAQAADAHEQAGDIDAACFFRTHAYVFALEEGLESAVGLRAKLKAHGREA